MSRVAEAKEKTEMAEIKERAEMKKLELTTDAFTGIDSEALKKSTLIRAINEEFEGSKVLGNTIITANGKYDILVDKNLNITVAKHGELAQNITLGYVIYEEWRKIVIIPTIEYLSTYEEFAQSVLDELPTDEDERNDELNRIFVDGVNYTMIKNGVIPEGITLTIEEITNGYTSIQEFYNDNMSTEFESCEAMMISYKFVEPKEYESITIISSNGESKTINMELQSSAEFEMTENGIYIFTAIGPNGETGELIIDSIEDYPEMKLLPGLYNAQYEILKTWEQLKTDGSITVEGTTLTRAGVEGNLVISDEIKTIGDGSLNLVGSICGSYGGKSNITKVYIPSTVEKIANKAFEGCDELKEVVIEKGLNEIGDNAFNECANLTNINIPNSVTSIGNWAFSECSSLASINIPNSVTSIGNGVFAFSEGLTSITVDENNTVYDSRNNCNAIIEKTTNILIGGCSNTIIPSTVSVIGDYAFSGCKGLTSITIPSSVISIEDYAFSDCGGLTSITIPDSITSIGNHVFSYCSSLTSITIPNSITSIGNYAFYGCKGLTSITIPSSVESIGNYAFEMCSGLARIKVDENNQVYDSRNDCNAIIKTETNELIQGCSSTIIPNDITSIGSYAFSGCTGLTSITIPSSVTSIGTRVFSGCTGLTSITIPSSVTTIENYAFEGCTGLKEIKCEAEIRPSGWESNWYYNCSSSIIKWGQTI